MKKVYKEVRMTLGKSAELCIDAEERALLGEPWIERPEVRGGLRFAGYS